jgi:hypothetical protein
MKLLAAFHFHLNGEDCLSIWPPAVCMPTCPCHGWVELAVPGGKEGCRHVQPPPVQPLPLIPGGPYQLLHALSSACLIKCLRYQVHALSSALIKCLPYQVPALSSALSYLKIIKSYQVHALSDNRHTRNFAYHKKTLAHIKS